MNQVMSKKVSPNIERVNDQRGEQGTGEQTEQWLMRLIRKLVIGNSLKKFG